MKTNFSILALAMTSILTTTNALAGPAHIDDGMQAIDMSLRTVDTHTAKHRVKGQQLRVSTQADDTAIIDITVLVHPSYLEAMSTPLSKDANGKYYENGAQFVYDRVNAQVERLNQTLEAQNVGAQLRINYLGTINLEIEQLLVGPENYSEHRLITNCIYYNTSSECNNPGDFLREREIVGAESDLILYVREYFDEEVALGIGSYLSSISLYDNYVDFIQRATNIGEESLESVRFGNQAYNVFAHEFGHVMGGQHEASDAEPFIGGEPHRAYACGKRDNPSLPYDASDVTTMKPTLLSRLSGTPGDENHPFFSDPEITVEGDVCGVTAEAENITTIRNTVNQVSDYRQPVADLSTVGFTIDQNVVSRDESKVSLVVRRTGDTTQSSFVTLVARDGTGWENRDFTFGISELKFAAGETEKTVDVAVLPRAEKHLDATFHVDVKYAIGSSIEFGTTEVTILTNNQAVPGVLSLQAATATTSETSSLTFTVERTGGADGAVSVSFTTVDGTALAGVDYTAVDRVLNFADGQTSMTVNVPVINRSGEQGNRSFDVVIEDATGGAEVGSQASASATISDAVVTPPAEGGGSSGGGSFGWFTLLAGALLLVRARSK